VANHLIFGSCNRLCTIQTGSVDLGYTEIFTGVMKDAPRYIGNNSGIPMYELSVSSLVKYLNEQSICSVFSLDGMSHTEAIKALCYAGQLLPEDIETDTDDTLLPDTRKYGSTGEIQSDLLVQYGDSPMMWINKICELTGWVFRDGYLSTGKFGFKYIDPYAMDATVKAYFAFKTGDCISDYQKIYDWNPYSLEPEANELLIIGTDALGNRIAGRYKDAASQDPAIEVALRPDNWLGTRRLVTVEVDYIVTPDWLKQQALRIGNMICRRRDMATFMADYPLQLWVGDVVQIYDSTMTMQGLGFTGISQYRITQISNIDFSHEYMDTPIRQATYEAVRIYDVV